MSLKYKIRNACWKVSGAKEVHAMGLSASQARMLSLTSRLSDLELRAQGASNAKIRLSDQAEQASQKYSDALDKQKLTIYSMESNSNTDLTLDALYDLNTQNGTQREIVDVNGNIVLNSQLESNFRNSMNAFTDNIAADGWVWYSGKDAGGNYTQNPRTSEEATANLYKNQQAVFFLLNTQGVTSWEAAGGDLETLISQGKTNKTEWNYYTSQFDKLYSQYTTPAGTYNTGETGAKIEKRILNIKSYADCENSAEWLQQQLSTGNLFIVEQDMTTNTKKRISYSSGDPAIHEVTDDSGVAKAEAEYETTMASIQAKDKRFDVQLANLDTEHTAVQTEVESVKKVISKNIERSLKMFDA